MVLRCNACVGLVLAGLLGVVLSGVAQAECGVPRKVWEEPVNYISGIAKAGATVYAGVAGGIHVVQESESPGAALSLPEGEVLDYIVGGTSSRLYYLSRAGTLYALELEQGNTREIATGFELFDSSVNLPGYSEGLVYAFAGDVLYYRLPRTGLWKTGGELVGSVEVRRYPVGNYPYVTDISPFAIRPWKDGIIFTAITETTGHEPWFSDGTTAGTELIADVVPLPEGDPSLAWLYSSFSKAYHIQGEYAYFISSEDDTVWRTDGTAEGTVTVPEVDSVFVTRLGGAQIGTGAGRLLRVSMGGDDVTLLYDHTLDHGPDVVLNNMTRLGDRVIYSVYAAGETPAGNIWVSDGTPAGTYRLYLLGSFLGAAWDDSYRQVFSVYDDTAYFFARSELRGAELWKTDGTLVGTGRLTDVNPGTGDSVVFNPEYGTGGSGQIIGDAFYFLAGDGDEEHLWVLDMPQRPEAAHDADTNTDFVLSLSELLRVIQFFNSGGYHVAASTEDGFSPGPGSTDGAPHDSDYLPQDWALSLSEILRAIQFFNSPTGGYCVVEGSEDGFSV